MTGEHGRAVMDDADLAPPGDDAAATRKLARTLAFVVAGLVLAVVITSASLRHAAAGLACSDWPACYGRASNAGAWGGEAFARIVHRLAASASLFVLGALLAVALKPATAWRAERRLVWIALATALALAALGLATPDARVPAVAIGNLAGGFALFATLAALAARLAPAPQRGEGATLARIALAAFALHAAIGATVGAQYAVTSCPAALACPAADPATLGGGAIDVLRPIERVDGRAVAPPGAAALVALHRHASIAIVLLALAAAFAARRRRALALAIASTAVLAASFGIGATLAQPSLALTVAHNAAAALLAAALAVASLRDPPVRA